MRKQVSELSKLDKSGEGRGELKQPKHLQDGIESVKRDYSKGILTRDVRCRSPKGFLSQGKSLDRLAQRCDEDDVRGRIGEIEKNMDGLYQRYKTLLGLSYKESSELVSVRKNMARVVDEIDLKSEELYDLKIQQQEFLKAKLLG